MPSDVLSNLPELSGLNLADDDILYIKRAAIVGLPGSSKIKYSTLRDKILAGVVGTNGVNVNPLSYGAVADGKIIEARCDMTAGSPVLTLDNIQPTTYPRFSAGDVGKVIAVYDAGPLALSGHRLPLHSTIIGYTSPTQVTLADNAVASVVHSERVVWGTDNTAAIQAAVDAVAALGGGCIEFPAGRFLTKGIKLSTSVVGLEVGQYYGGAGYSFPLAYHNISIKGQGMFVTFLENWDPTFDPITGDILTRPPSGIIEIGRYAGGPVYAQSKPVENNVISDISLQQVKNPYSPEYKGVYLGFCKNTVFRNVSVSNPSYEGIITGVSQYTYFYGCLLYNSGKGGPGYGNSTAGYNITSEYVWFYNCTAFDCFQGMELGGHYIRIDGLDCSNCFVIGINIGSTGIGIWDLDIANCNFRDCGSAIGITNSIGVLGDVRLSNINILNCLGGLQVNNGMSVNANVIISDGTAEVPARISLRNISIRFDRNVLAGSQTALAIDAKRNIVNVQDVAIEFENSAFPYPIVQIYKPGGSDIWLPNTAYVAAETSSAEPSYVLPLIFNGYIYKCTVAGNSGATEPVWPIVINNTVVDGTCTWKCVRKAPRIDIEGLRFIGPQDFDPSTTAIIQVAGGDRRALGLTNISANFGWKINEGVLLNKHGAEISHRPPVLYYPPNTPISTLTTFTEVPGEGAGVVTPNVDLIFHNGYWYAGTVLRRIQPKVLAGGNGYVVTGTGGYFGAKFRAAIDGDYTYGELVTPTVANGHVYVCIVGGTQGAEPAWPVGAGSTVTTGAVTFREVGAPAVFNPF